MGFKVALDKDKCSGCEACLGCLSCVEICEQEAITVEETGIEISDTCKALLRDIL